MRQKITVTIPYSSLEDGFAAQKAMKLAAEKRNFVEHPGVEFEFGEIEETSRDKKAPAA